MAPHVAKWSHGNSKLSSLFDRFFGNIKVQTLRYVFYGDLSVIHIQFTNICSRFTIIVVEIYNNENRIFHFSLEDLVAQLSES